MSNKQINLNAKFTVKSAEDDNDTLVIEGFANTTDKDRVGDVVLEEAWNKGGLDNYLMNPIILANHDYSKPIGKSVDYSISKKGLRIVAEISKAAGDVYQLIQEGILKTFSIGFRVKDADYDEKTDIFVIKDLELLEISVVSIPANQFSTFSVKKSFDTEETYNEFKGEFKEMPDNTDIDKKINAALAKQQEQMSALLDLMTEEKTAAKAKAEAEEKAAEKATERAAEKAAEKAEAASVTATAGVEKLLADVEARFEDKNKGLEEVLDGLRAELKEKADDLEALQKSRMTFEDKSGQKIANADVDKAILLSTILGKSVNETKFGKDLIEKANIGAHTTGINEEWQREFSSRINQETKDRLIVEPLFTVIPMNTMTMVLPINPETGIAQWIPTTDYRSSTATENDASTGDGRTHTPTDTTMVAHKLASKEYIGYEEEEDTLLPLMSLIQDAVVRRMARSSDIAILRGDAGVSATEGGADDGGLYPFDGLTNLAQAATAANTLSISAGDKVTVATLAAVRREVGVLAHNPSDIKYIVSQDAYFDLLEDPDFRTVDLVGNKATILTGQVGSVNGSPVMVSDSYKAKAANSICVTAVYTPGFVVGNLRSMMVERDRDITNQKNVIVATRRLAFKELMSNQESVAVAKWTT